MQPVYKAQPPTPIAIYDWTGFYIGAHGGGAWTDKPWSLPGFGELVSYTASGRIGGVQAGFNWQTGIWVLGVEAQASFGESAKARRGSSRTSTPGSIRTLTRSRAGGW